MPEYYNLENDKIQSFLRNGRKNIEVMERLVTEYKPMLSGKRFLTDSELSKFIGLSRRTLQDYRDRGILPYYRFDGKILYEEKDVETYLNSIFVPKYR